MFEAGASRMLNAPETLHRQIGQLDRQQIAVWRGMQPSERLELAFQAYQFVLEMVRATEAQRHPELAGEELAWRVTRRMQGRPDLGC